jgi:hypothetical protein
VNWKGSLTAPLSGCRGISQWAATTSSPRPPRRLAAQSSSLVAHHLQCPGAQLQPEHIKWLYCGSSEHQSWRRAAGGDNTFYSTWFSYLYAPHCGL